MEPPVDPLYDPTSGDLPASAPLMPDEFPDPPQDPVDLGHEEDPDE